MQHLAGEKQWQSSRFHCLHYAWIILGAYSTVPLLPCSQHGERATWPCGNAGKYQWDLNPSVYRHCETVDCVPGCAPFTKCCCLSSPPWLRCQPRPQTDRNGGMSLSHPLQILGHQEIKSHLHTTSP